MGQRGRRSIAAAGVLAMAVCLLAAAALLRRDTTTCRTWRGVPDSGIYVGAAVGGNDDPRDFEASISAKLAIRRTYYAADDVDSAIATARADLDAGRLPWVSFKFPTTWERMAHGEGDAWVRGLAQRVAQLPGPVWVTFHHEPEGDGDVSQWRRAQERVGPLLRSGAPNAAYAVVLTGWNQVFGPAELALDRIWPDTQVDVAGFDVYEFDPTADRTEADAQWANTMAPLIAWANARRQPWALAETGHAAPAADTDHTWISRTTADAQARGAVALVYFNSNIHSDHDWRMTRGSQITDFARALAGSRRVGRCAPPDALAGTRPPAVRSSADQSQ